MAPLPSISALRSQLRSDSLRGRVMSGGLWSVTRYGISQLLRFASNVVLARLLFPEAFGVMLLVNTVIQGLEMFSDVGTTALIVQSRRGEEPAFLRTAYTIKVIRGFALWALAAALAWPASLLFGKPELAFLLPVAAANAALIGLQSTRLTLASRSLQLGPVTMLTIGSQVLSIVVMIACAWVWPSVWALVIGSLVGNATNLVGSYVLFPGARDRFGWDREAAREMLRFGRWIFLSTALAFLAGRGDTLLMGRLLTTTELGVYGIALNLALIVSMAVGQLGTNVLFPAYSRVWRESPDQLGEVLRRSRLALLGGGALAYLPLVVLGGALLRSLYDDRYVEAGWMLQTLSCGFMLGLLHRSYDGVLHAKGLSFESSVLQFFQVAIKFTCFTLGFLYFGLPGFIVGVAFSSWVSYPIVAAVMSRAGVWQPRIDGVVLLLGAVGAATFFVFGPLA